MNFAESLSKSEKKHSTILRTVSQKSECNGQVPTVDGVTWNESLLVCERFENGYE